MQILNKAFALASFALAILAPAAARAAEYSVYLLSPAADCAASDLRVHVWGDKGDVKEWANDDHLSAEHHYIANDDGSYTPVYEYHFSYDGTPTNIIFRKGDGQTSDLVYTDGALYDYNNTDKTTTDFSLYTANYTTVYFADERGRDISKVSADFTGALGIPVATDTHKYYKDAEGDMLRVYSYTADYVTDLPQVTFGYKDGDGAATFTATDNTLFTLGAAEGVADAASRLEVWAPTYTVYLFNPSDVAVAAGDWRVHVWDEGGTPYKEWGENDGVEPTGKYVLYDDKYYEVLSYTFSWDSDLKCIIFHSDRPSAQTDDLDFVDGALYGFTAQKSGVQIRLDSGDFTLLDPATATVYFYDTQGWGFKGTKAAFSGNVIAESAANDYLYYEAPDGQHYPVYAYTATYLGEEPTVTFSGKADGHPTATFTAIDNSLFSINATEGLAGASGLIGEWSGTYTVYFFNLSGYRPDAADWRVHVWDEDDIAYKEWASNDGAQSTGKYVVYNKEAYEVMSYTFKWNHVPTGVIFHINNSQQSSDFSFADGHLYAFQEGKAEVDLAATEYELLEPRTSTIYFADVRDFGEYNVRAHIWGEGGDYRRFQDSPTMEPTGKYAKVQGIYVPVYKLDVVTPLTDRTDFVQVRRGEPNLQSLNAPFIDGALYMYAKSLYNDTYTTDFTLVDEVPVTPGTIYYHIGANQILTGLWKKPRARLHRIGAILNLEPGEDFDDTADDTEAMYEIEPGTWAIDVDNVNLYNTVTFYYYHYSNDLNAWKVEEFPAYKDEYQDTHYFDPTTYAMYVYDVGTYCVFQSYVTVEQFNEIRRTEPETIYFLGNKASGFDNDDMLPNRSKEIPSEHGVFFHSFQAGSQEMPALFKLSSVDVDEYVALAGESDRYENQRGWATFNMGLFGYDNAGPGRELFVRKTWGENRCVVLEPNVTVRYNNYNQYGWDVGVITDSEGHSPIEEGKTYWLVVDTHADDQSVTLLDFDPNPQVEISDGDIQAFDLGYDKARSLHRGDILAASANHGEVYFDRVNVATGTAKISAAPNDHLTQSDYSVVYTVYVNGVPAATHDGVPDGEMLVPFIPLSKDVTVNTRARYTSSLSGYSFCSRFGHGKVDAVPTLAAPTLVNLSAHLAIDRGVDSETALQPYDAFLDYQYFVQGEGSDDLVYYGDFSVEALSGSHIDNPALADGGHLRRPGEFFGLGRGEIQSILFEDDGEYSDAHNWAKEIVVGEKLPVYLRDVLQLPAGEAPDEVQMQVTAHAVYPFLVNMSTTLQQQKAPRRKANGAAEVVLPDDLSGFKIVPLYASSTVRQALGEDNVITGIADVSASDSDVPAEYFNLQGIRVAEPAVPGIYLRRQGSVTAKILVK